MKFDFEAARSAGYSDDEIAGYLAKENNFDLGGALESGYTSTEVIDFLSAPKGGKQDLPSDIKPSEGRSATPMGQADPRIVQPRDDRGIIQRVGEFLKPEYKSVMEGYQPTPQEQQANIDRRLSYGAGPISSQTEATADLVRSGMQQSKDATVNKVAQSMEQRNQPSFGDLVQTAKNETNIKAARDTKAAEFRSAGEWAADTLSNLAQGTVTLAQLPTDIIAPSSSLAKSLRETQKELQAQESTVLQAQRDQLRERVQNESGFFDKYVATVVQLATNPALGLSEAVKQVPMFLGVVGGARAAGGAVGLAGNVSPTLALSEALSGNAIRGAATNAGGAAASMVMAGGDAAGGVYEKLTDRNQTPMSVWQQNPDFQQLKAEGKTDNQAIEEIATAKARLAAVVTAPLGLLGFMGAESALASKGLGKATSEALTFAGAGKLVAKDVIGEQLEEGGTQFGGNVVSRTVDPNQKLSEGVPEAMGTALVTSTPFSALGARSQYKEALDATQRVDVTGDAIARDLLNPQSYDPNIISPTQTAKIANFTPADSATKQAGLVDIEVPMPDAPAPMLPSIDQTGGVNVSTGGLPQTEVAGGSNAGSNQLGGGLGLSGSDVNVATGQLGGRAGLPAPNAGQALATGNGATQQPAGLSRPFERATNEDLMARTEAAVAAQQNNNADTQPAEQWVGRKGDGYVTQADAAQAIGGRQRMFPNLDWKIEQMPSGKFRLAGYNTETTNGNQTTQAVQAEAQGQEAPVASARQLSDLEQRQSSLPDAVFAGLSTNPQSADIRGRTQSYLDSLVTTGRLPEVPQLGTPDVDAEGTINALANLFGAATGIGNRVVAYSQPNGDNGFALSGIAFVNTAMDSSSVDAPRTTWHELRHVAEQLGKAGNKAAQEFTAQMDSIFDDMTDEGKRAYIENFMFKSEIAGITDPVAREARINEILQSPELRSEMVADFLGNRSQDRKFLIDLAQSDPQGFEGFVRKWLAVIDNLIAKLRGGKTQGQKESAKVDQYIRDLNKAKMVARDALIAFRKGNLEAQGQAAKAVETEAEMAMSARQGETVGDFKVRTMKDGTAVVYGDPEAIRAQIPEDVKGRVTKDGIVFTTAAAARVKAALGGRSTAYSREGAVLDKLPMRNGKYLGAPTKFDTPSKIPTLRKLLRQLADEGAPGRYWYENSGREVLKMVGGDVQEARKFVALLAIYSPQAKVDANSTFALRAWAQYKAGQSISVKTGVMDTKAKNALDDVEAFWSGEKTGNFFFNLLREIDPSTKGKQGATIDMWMMRAGQYETDAPTSTQYAFMENETNRLAAELGWEPQQVQAAIWVAMKARMENKGVKKMTEASSEKKGWIRYDYPLKNGKPFKTRVIIDEQKHRDNWLKYSFAHDVTKDDTQQAKFDFGDGLKRHIGQVSFEARPGRTTNVLSGIHSAPYAQQVEFQQAVQKAFLDEQGNDLLAMRLGLLVDNDILVPGVWQGEISPSTQLGVAMAPAKGDEGKTNVDPAQAKALNVYAAIAGLVARQEGVGWHRPFYSSTKRDANGLDIDVGRPLNPREVADLENAVGQWMTDNGHDGWQNQFAFISSPNGIRLVNFGIITNEKLHSDILDVAGSVLPDAKAQWFASSGDMMTNDWKEKQNGQDYIDRASAEGRSDVLDWARAYLAPRVQQVFDDFSKRYDWGDAGELKFSRRDGGRGQGIGGAQDRQVQAPERATSQEAISANEPLLGAPRIQGFTGPDPRLVAVAEQYARDNGITLRRQAEYVQIDPERASRIAQAYEDMPHSPNDLRVKAAYKELIKQTVAQYRALEKAGYKFWFMDMNKPDNQEYASSPWNAMRDIRANQTMGVFPTDDGFGSSDFDPSSNPLLEDTGIKWPSGSMTGPRKRVLANDLFRAVHDAFGHGLEGAGFRAQGEENAWQAHVRLFKGKAVAAITSETRGQNSWLNYGPKGESNRTAKVEDTVFADQKTGLMPQWTWTEGVVGDMPAFSKRDKPQFYSQLERSIAGVPDRLATQPAPQWKAWIASNAPKLGIKKDEIEWSGINDYLDLRGKDKVTKDDIVAYLKDNGVRVEEVKYGTLTDRERFAEAQRVALEDYGVEYGELDGDDQTSVDESIDEENSQYGDYTLPNGENYRELVLTLPSMPQKDIERMMYLEAKRRRLGEPAQWVFDGDKEGKELKALQAKAKEDTFQSNHFDAKNIVAHIRANDRTDADGNKVLFIEEVQSDWGQGAKKRGFKGNVDEAKAALKKFTDDMVAKYGIDGMAAGKDTPEEQAEFARLSNAMSTAKNGLPRAPFVTKTEGWLNLALKRIAMMAVEGGYDKVAFVNGMQSAERYDLSKSIESIGYDPKEKTLDAYDKNRSKVMRREITDPSQLDDYVGKEVAKRLLEQPLVRGKHLLEGENIKVGGEGMIKFYDEIVPQALNKLLPKLGGEKLGTVELNVSGGLQAQYEYQGPTLKRAEIDAIARSSDLPTSIERQLRDIGSFVEVGMPMAEAVQKYGSISAAEALGGKLIRLKDPMSPQLGFNVTDEMRETVGAGVPMFSEREKPESNLQESATNEEPPQRNVQKRQRLVGSNFEMDQSSKVDTARIKLQDDALRMKRVIEAVKAKGGKVGEAQNFYDANTLMSGRIQAAIDDFKNEIVKPMLDKAAKFKIDLDELAMYAYAKHAKERNAHVASINKRMPDGGSGMTNDEADTIIQMVELAGDKDKFDELHKMLMGITSATRQLMLSEGLITEEEFNQIDGAYEDYIPLRGFEDVDEETGTARMGVGRGINIRGAETIRAMGRKSKAGDLIENVIRDYEKVIARVEKNDVGKVLLDFVLSNPDPELWGVDIERTKPTFNKAKGVVQYTKSIEKGEDTIGVKVGGQQVYIKMADKELTRALRNAWKDETSGLERVIVATTGWWNNWMRNVLTKYNPAFAAINIPRDALWSGTAAALDELGTKGLGIYLKSYGKALMASTRQELGVSGTSSIFGNPQIDALFKEFRAAGGITGGFYMRSLEDINKDLRGEMLLSGASPRGAFEKVQSLPPYKLAKLTLRVLEFMGAASENATRFALFMAAKESGKSSAKAAVLAKDGTTNFNRKGEWGGALNNLYLFFNAAVQGNAQLIKVLKNPKVQASMAGVAGVGMMLAAYGASAGGEDDDGEKYWDKIPSYIKERNLVIMLPPGDALAGGIERVGKRGRYITIPVQYGFNIFPNIGYMLSDVMRNAEDPKRGVTPTKAALHMTSVVFGSVNPFGGSVDVTDGVQVLLAVAPTLADLPLQLANERGTFGTPSAPSKSPFDKRPDSERMFMSQQGSVSAKIAKTLNELGGGNEAKAGSVLGAETSVTPGTIDTIIRSTTGGLGSFIEQVGTAVISMTGDDKNLKANKIPFLNKFYGEVDEDANIRSAGERMREVKKVVDEVKEQQRIGLDPELKDDEQRLNNLASMQASYQRAQSQMRKAEIEIIKDAKMTDAEKRLARQRIQVERDKLATDVNREYLNAVKK
jgi:hypothetical protein